MLATQSTLAALAVSGSPRATLNHQRLIIACAKPPDGLSELRLHVSKPPQRQYKAVHPTAMTCVPKLYLPEYDTKKDLKAKLIFALENSAGFDDRVGNVQSF